MARVLLGRLLLDAGQISEAQLRSAMSHQDRWGSRIGESLVSLGYLSERGMLEALGRQLGLPFMEIGERRIPAPVLALVPAAVIRRRRVLPVALLHEHGRTGPLVLAVSDPSDSACLDEVAFASGLDVRPVLAGKKDLEQAIDRHFTGGPRSIELPPDPGPLQLTIRGQKN
jgi:type IV pilus assembly protein PilB